MKQRLLLFAAATILAAAIPANADVVQLTVLEHTFDGGHELSGSDGELIGRDGELSVEPIYLEDTANLRIRLYGAEKAAHQFSFVTGCYLINESIIEIAINTDMFGAPQKETSPATGSGSGAGCSTIVENLPDGHYKIRFHAYSGMITHEGNFTIDHKSAIGKQVITPTVDLMTDENKEWVLYNPGNASVRPFFYTMHFDGKEADGAGRLWLNTGNGSPIHIASVRDERDKYVVNDVSVRYVDAEIPTRLWGLGFTDKTIRTTAGDEYFVRCPQGQMNMFWLTPINDYNVLGDVIGWRVALVDGSSARMIERSPGVWREKIGIAHGTANPNYETYELNFSPEGGGYWIEGIGPVGTDYSSNPAFPLYYVPEEVAPGGIIPTRLLCVRDRRDGSILYCDPEDEPLLGKLASAPQTAADPGALTAPRLCGQRISAQGEGTLTLSIYAPDGALLGRASGEGAAAIDTSSLPQGLVIATVSSPQGSASARIIVR